MCRLLQECMKSTAVSRPISAKRLRLTIRENSSSTGPSPTSSCTTPRPASPLPPSTERTCLRWRWNTGTHEAPVATSFWTASPWSPPCWVLKEGALSRPTLWRCCWNRSNDSGWNVTPASSTATTWLVLRRSAPSTPACWRTMTSTTSSGRTSWPIFLTEGQGDVYVPNLTRGTYLSSS